MKYDKTKIEKFIPKYMNKNGHYSIEVSFATEELMDFNLIFSNIGCLYKNDLGANSKQTAMVLHDHANSLNSIFILKSGQETEITITGGKAWFSLIFETMVIDVVNGSIYFYYKDLDEDTVAYSNITSFTILK